MLHWLAPVEVIAGTMCTQSKNMGIFYYLLGIWHWCCDKDFLLFFSLIIHDQFYTVQNFQRSPISQTSNWSRTFFAVSYSKPVLVKKCLFQIDAYMFWPNLIKKSVTVSKCLRYKLTPTRLTCTLKSNTTLYPKNNKDKL